ncbi:hypothetical protein ccbrp13_21350 [Ktedonobacteria bacterium brp13]|nr:hypothetical protein ccbrp13_21350 [Ktedonobacteria bacterium brp13]
MKYLYACVQENNSRDSIKNRFEKQQQSASDPDRKMGVKHNTNVEQHDGSTKEKKELLWSYDSRVAVATMLDDGDVVLAHCIMKNRLFHSNGKFATP